MSIAKLRLDESTKLEFGVEISGAEGKPKARFVIEGKDYSISYPCHPMSGGGIDVELGNFKNMLPAGEYPVRLEIVIENKIFVPFEDTIVLEPTVEITSKPKAVREIKESVKVEQVSVTAVKKNNTAKQMKIAGLIAEALDYTPSKEQTPEEIVNESLSNRKPMNEKKGRLVAEMLKAANEAEIIFDKSLLK